VLAGNREAILIARRRPSCPRLGGSGAQQTQSVDCRFTRAIDSTLEDDFGDGLGPKMERDYYLEELTMKKVGALLDIGESRVSQIHTAALIRLRSHLQSPLGACLGFHDS